MSILVLDREYKEYQDLKERVDKAIEYIEKLTIEDYDSNAYFIQDKYDKWLGIEEIPNKLLEILKGSDSNE